MCDRLRVPTYTETQADLDIARANSWQMHYHLVGGLLAFFVSPAVEVLACGLALYRGMLLSSLLQPQGSSADLPMDLARGCWLGLMLVRAVALLAVIISSVRMNLEMWFRHDWHDNPIRASLPEQYVIQVSENYRASFGRA